MRFGKGAAGAVIQPDPDLERTGGVIGAQGNGMADILIVREGSRAQVGEVVIVAVPGIAQPTAPG